MLTEAAVKRIKSLLKKHPLGTAFRIRVDAGGCNGFQYAFSFDKNVNDDDITHTEQDVPVVVDEVSKGFLENVQVDFVEELIGSYFKVVNPNATSTCGCGSSFSL